MRTGLVSASHATWQKLVPALGALPPSVGSSSTSSAGKEGCLEEQKRRPDPQPLLLADAHARRPEEEDDELARTGREEPGQQVQGCRRPPSGSREDANFAFFVSAAWRTLSRPRPWRARRVSSFVIFSFVLSASSPCYQLITPE
jgi:hypothetical protein